LQNVISYFPTLLLEVVVVTFFTHSQLIHKSQAIFVFVNTVLYCDIVDPQYAVWFVS